MSSADAAPVPPRSDLPARVVTALGLVSVALLALWAGGFFFWLVVAVAAMFMMAEWSDLAKADARHKRIAQFSLFAALSILSPLAAGPDPFALGLVAGAAFFTAIVTRRSMLGTGTFYVGLPVFALLLLRQESLLLAVWALSLVWATDTGAFFVGRTVGGPKVAPAISPSKTWSGLVGGMAGAALLAGVLNEFFGLPFALALATPFLALAAQAGDFYESWLKRRAGVKDSGTILPGHGGFLDRLDGVVPVAPLAALLVELQWLWA